MASNTDNGNTSTEDRSQQNATPGKPEVWWKRFFKTELCWFLIFSFVVSWATICQMDKANRNFKESHQRIIDQNKNCQELTNSFLQFYQEIDKDTTLSSQDRLTIAAKLDSLNEKIVRQDFDQKITNLLEIESTKIQNEFEVLNLWCALLTVVFLIFSFFSIFKTNEMSRRGEDALKALRATEIEAERKSESIDAQVTAAVSTITAKEAELTKNFQDKVKKFQDDLDEKGRSLTALGQSIDNVTKRHDDIEKSQNTLDKRIEDKIEEEKTKISGIINTQVSTEISSFIKEKDQLFKQVVSDLDVLNKKFLSLTQRVDKLYTEGSAEGTQESDELDDIDNHEVESDD
ncbi:MAG: hypothetical protein K2H85_02000 [Allobaculum sp.]|nr:hypothetical protein [Allobaculum sp.]